MAYEELLLIGGDISDVKTWKPIGRIGLFNLEITNDDNKLTVIQVGGIQPGEEGSLALLDGRDLILGQRYKYYTPGMVLLKMEMHRWSVDNNAAPVVPYARGTVTYEFIIPRIRVVTDFERENVYLFEAQGN